MSTRSIGRPKGSNFSRWLAVCGIGGLLGCSEIQPVAPVSAPISDPTLVYKALIIDYPAVTMSTAPGYNTVQLTATPIDGNGNPLANVSAPILWSSGDPTVLKVSSTGVLTAVGVSADVDVLVYLTIGPLTHGARVKVAVTNLTDPPQLATLSIHPVPPDSAIISLPSTLLSKLIGTDQSVYNFVQLRIDNLSDPTYTGYKAYNEGWDPTVTTRMLDAAGAPIPGLKVAYSSPDNVRIGSEDFLIPDFDVDPGQFTRDGPPGSSIRLVAKALAYGVAKADTVAYTLTYPVAATVHTDKPNAQGELVAAFNPSEVTIAPYGYVGWFNLREDRTVDVTFDDPTHVVAPPAGFCTAIKTYYDDVITPFFFLSIVDDNFCAPGNVTVPMRPIFPYFDLGAAKPFLSLFTLELRQFPVPGVYTYHSVSTGATGRIVVRDH